MAPITDGAPNLTNAAVARRGLRRPRGAVGTDAGVRPAVVLLIFAEVVGAVVGWQAWAMGSDRAGFAGLGLTMSAITSVPLASRRHPLFSMWGMVCFATAVGAGARGIVIALNYPDPQFVGDFFLGGQTFEEMFTDGMVALATMIALTGGYMLGLRSKRHRKQNSASKWQLGVDRHGEVFAIGVAFFYAGVGTLATIGYWLGVGGLGGSLHARRGTVTESGSASSTFGYFEVLAEASAIAAIVMLAYWCAARPRIGIGRGLVLAVLFLDALALNLLTTTRSDVLYLTLAALAVVAIVRGTVPIALIVCSALAVLLAIGGLTAARSTTDSDGSGFSVRYGIDSGLLNRNAYDIGKTLRVIHAVPDVLPYEHGQTITVFFFAPIPRAMWPDKPIISAGRDVGQTLYNTTNSGIPPGMSGELVWNFGRVPAVVLSFAIGLLLAWIERRRGSFDPTRLTSVIFYAVVIFPLGKNILGVSIGNAIITAAGSVLLLVPLLLLTRMSSSSRKRNSASRPRTS